MVNKNRPKLVIMRPFPEDAPARFADFDAVEVHCGDIADADIIMGQPGIEEIKRCKNLKWLQISSAGADSYAKHPEVFKNIRLTTVSGAFGQSISEWVLALTLSLYKRLNLFRDNQNARLWRDEGRQLSPFNKRVLVLGCGDLGSSVARMFKRFNCRVCGIRKHVSLSKPEGFDEVFGLDRLDDALPLADILVGTLPETHQTVHLMNEFRLKRLKPGAVVINVGRGSLIDLDALSDLLRNGYLYGAALDVTYPEPLGADHPLWRTPNCILTPHASGGSFGHLKETEEKIYAICRENLRRFLQGENLLNELDFASGYRGVLNRY